jgi:hypothetical protein
VEPERERKPFDEFRNPLAASLPRRAAMFALEPAPRSIFSAPPLRKLSRTSATVGDDYSLIDSRASTAGPSSPVLDEPFMPRKRAIAQRDRLSAASEQLIDLVSDGEEEEELERTMVQSALLASLQPAAAVDNDDEASVDNRAPVDAARPRPTMVAPNFDSDGELIVSESSGDEFVPIRTQADDDEEEAYENGGGGGGGRSTDDEDDDVDDKIVRRASSAAQVRKSNPLSTPTVSSAATMSKSPAVLELEAAQADLAAADARARVARAAAAVAAEATSSGAPKTPPTSRLVGSLGLHSGAVVAEVARRSSALSLPGAAGEAVRRASALAPPSDHSPAAQLDRMGRRMSSLGLPIDLSAPPHSSPGVLPFDMFARHTLQNKAAMHAQLDEQCAALPHVSMSLWLRNKQIRVLLVNCVELWTAGSERVRMQSPKTRLSYTSVGATFLEALQIGRCDVMTLVQNEQQLMHQVPREVLAAIAAAAPTTRWRAVIESRLASSTAHQAGLFLERLLCWSISCERVRLSSEHSPEIDLCVPIKEMLSTLVKAWRQAQRVEVNGRRTLAGERTSTYTALADTLREVAAFKCACESAVTQFDVARAPLAHKRVLALLALIGAFDIVALRIGAAYSRAGDLTQCADGVREADLAIARFGRRALTLRAYENQKMHVLAPYDVQQRAPITTRLLNALLDDAEFVHGTPVMVGRASEALERLMRGGAELLRLSVPAVLCKPNAGSVQPGELQRSSCRRLWVSMAMLLVLWTVLEPVHFVAICYAQLHDPRTAVTDYFVFGGIFQLVGHAAADCEAAIVDKYNEVVVRTNQGVVSPAAHRQLIEQMWTARDAIARACRAFSQPEFACPKCNVRIASRLLAQHLAECLVRSASMYTEMRQLTETARVQVGGRRRTPKASSGASTMRLGGAPPSRK